MIDETRAKWHLTLPVCRIKRGLQTHLSLISFDDLHLLMVFCGCTLEDLIDKAWFRSKQLRGMA